MTAVKRAASKTAVEEKQKIVAERGKRSYLSQTDVPGCTLDDALRVPRAIAENYAAKPTSPLNVAAALGMQPNAGRFRLLSGAAIAYGVTSGGPYGAEIAITPPGLRIVRPTEEGDDLPARREALLRPRIVGEFLQKYNNAPLPQAEIARNVLLEMGVPKDRAAEVVDFIPQGADSVGILREIKGKRYVDLTGLPQERLADVDEESDVQGHDEAGDETPPDQPPAAPRSGAVVTSTQERRVFHGRNKALIAPIKKLLGFGELEPVVSVDRTSVSQPVPDKVMSDMRSCGAAIIHVDAEQTLIDKEAAEHVVLNPNVLIEIGAAMALPGVASCSLSKKV